MNDKRSVVQRMAAVGAALGNIPKNSENKQQNYKYTSYEDLATAVRTHFFKEELVLIPQVLSAEYSPTIKGQGKEWVRATIMVKYIVKGPDDDSIEYIIAAEGEDGGDKSIRKATTCANKIFLLSAFMISTADDNTDADATDPPERAVRTRTTPPPKKSAPEGNQGSYMKDQYRERQYKQADADNAKQIGGCTECHKPFDQHFTREKAKNGRCYACNNKNAVPKGNAIKFFLGKLKNTGISIQELKALTGAPHTDQIPEWAFNQAIYNTAYMKDKLGKPVEISKPVSQKPQKSGVDLDQDDPFNEGDVPPMEVYDEAQYE